MKRFRMKAYFHVLKAAHDASDPLRNSPCQVTASVEKSYTITCHPDDQKDISYLQTSNPDLIKVIEAQVTMANLKTRSIDRGTQFL